MPSTGTPSSRAVNQNAGTFTRIWRAPKSSGIHRHRPGRARSAGFAFERTFIDANVALSASPVVLSP
jgi:hypothetical protein